MTQRLHLWAPAFKGGDGIAQFSSQIEAACAHLGLACQSLARPTLAGSFLRSVEKVIVRVILSIAFAVKVGAMALVSRPDLIVSTHLNFGPMALLLKRLLGIPYVLVAHGIDVHEQLSPMRRQALVSADAVWAVSHWTAQRLQNYQLVSQSARVLPNTVSPSTFFPKSQPPNFLRQRYGIDPSAPIILTVARLEAREGYKGYDTVIQSIPKLLAAYPNLHYLIAGRGSDRDRLQQLIRDLDLLDHVSLIGFVPDEELADHYRLADVFAMPSTGEGFGIVFLEALACGCPVLAGNQDGSADALAGGKLGLLVNPTDIQSVTDGLHSLLARQGPALWFNPVKLHQVVMECFGPAAFHKALEELIMPLLLCKAPLSKVGE